MPPVINIRGTIPSLANAFPYTCRWTPCSSAFNTARGRSQHERNTHVSAAQIVRVGVVPVPVARPARSPAVADSIDHDFADLQDDDLSSEAEPLPALAVPVITPLEEIHRLTLASLVAVATRHDITSKGMNAILACLSKQQLLISRVPQSDESLPKWPKTLNDAATSESSNDSETHDRYVMCPNKQCGELYRMKELETHKQVFCSRRLAFLVEESRSTHSDAERHDRLCVDSKQVCYTRIIDEVVEKTKANSRLPDAQKSKRYDAILEYHHIGLRRGLERVLARPGVEASCEKFRVGRSSMYDRDYSPEQMSDIFDGRRCHAYMYTHRETHRPWTEYECKTSERCDRERDLLAAPGTLALAMNVDWFAPFLQGNTYSMGEISMAILNLPREERYKPENMILVGLLPGPKKTSREQLQSVLHMVVAELKELFHGKDHRGMLMRTNDAPTGRYVRAFLLCVIADTPAAREVCGFAGTSSKFGCPYCDHEFNARDIGTYRDYSWIGHHHPPTTDEVTRQRAAKWVLLIKQGVPEVEALKQSHGVRFSALNDLPYFDMIKGTPIDVMHCVLLGLCKAVMVSLTHTYRMTVSEVEQNAAHARTLAKDKGSVSRIHEMRQEGENFKLKVEDKTTGELKWFEETHECLNAHKSSIVELKKLVKKSDLTTWTVSQKEKRDGQWKYMLSWTATVATGSVTVSQWIIVGQPGCPQDLINQFEDSVDEDDEDNLVEEVDPAEIDAKIRRANTPIIEYPAALLPADMAILQAFVDASQCPREIGRIPRKIASVMASLSASEWQKWQCIFAVPACARLMAYRPTTKFTEAHLQLLIDLQSAVSLLRMYVTTTNEADQIGSLLFSILKSVGLLFGRSSVKPNFHLGLHLKDMLYDYGPSAGWSCNPFERLIGMLKGMPLSRSAVEVGTIKRYLLMLHSADGAAKSTHLATIGGVVEPYDWEWVRRIHHGHQEATGDPVNTGDDGFKQYFSFHSSGERQHVYEWVMQDAGLSYSMFRAQSEADIETDVRGCERFPGVFHGLIGLKNIEMSGQWGTPPWLSRLLQITNNLRAHYSNRYQEDVGQRMVTAGKITRKELYDKSVTRRDIYKTWLYINLGSINPLIKEFHKLSMAGQEYGSASKFPLTSYVTSKFSDGPPTSTLWYGQVLLFFEHEFADKVHSFALVQWFDRVMPGPGTSSTIKKLRERSPILKRIARQPQVGDLIAVQRLSGRWFPSILNDTEMQALHLPCRLHA